MKRQWRYRIFICTCIGFPLIVCSLSNLEESISISAFFNFCCYIECHNSSHKIPPLINIFHSTYTIFVLRFLLKCERIRGFWKGNGSELSKEWKQIKGGALMKQKTVQTCSNCGSQNIGEGEFVGYAQIRKRKRCSHLHRWMLIFVQIAGISFY